MKKNILFILVCFFSVSLFAQTKKLSSERHELMAGVAKLNITPGIPIPMSGYGGRNDPFKGVHDDLFARVIVFSDGENKAAFISTDLIGISDAIWKETTDRLTKETGIKKEYIMLSAVHNHSGPVLKIYDGEDTSAAVNAYIEELERKLISATKDALSRLAPVAIGAGKGECRMNISRRAADGKGETMLGVNPYAPCDHEVGVISVTDKSGLQIAIIIDWPSHAVVLGPKNYLITGDWPEAASKFVEESVGGKMIAPVFIGASGDINPVYGPHIDFEDNNSYAFGKDAIGADLGQEALRVTKEIHSFSSGRIAALQRVVSLPAVNGDSVKLRLSVIRIGNIILTGVSGEVFNQISVKMRTLSPYAYTFMITHCNGSNGYLVTEDAYPKEGVKGFSDKYHPRGGYEPGATKVKTGAEKAIVENLLDMISGF